MVSEKQSAVVDPSTLLRLIEDSGYSFPVIDNAIALLRRGLARVDTTDPALVEILRQHLLAVGSQTDVSKFFSLELLQRANATRAIDVMVEVVELLARTALVPERPYHVERAMVRTLGTEKVARALPALALLAGRDLLPICRTAAKAIVTIVGSEDAGAISDRLAADDLPEASRPRELANQVVRALDAVKRSATGSDRDARRTAQASPALPEGSDAFLRPETRKARQTRLRAVMRDAGRDPSRCGNCDLQGKCTVVHVVPPSRGGSDRSGNLVPLCSTCRGRLPKKVREAEAAPPQPSETAPQLGLF